MGFWKNLIGIEDDDDEEEELEELEEEKTPRFSFNFGSKKEEAEPVKEEVKPAPTFLKKPETRTTPAPAPAAAPAAPARTAAPRTSAPAASAATGRKFTDQFKMVVIEPQSFEESPKLVDNLRAKKPVIINLENLETDVARKIFDFLSGATYALNGNVQKIANNIFVFTPDNVDVAYSKGSAKTSAADDSVKSPWK